jgi:hypothetical protein
MKTISASRTGFASAVRQAPLRPYGPLRPLDVLQAKAKAHRTLDTLEPPPTYSAHPMCPRAPRGGGRRGRRGQPPSARAAGPKPHSDSWQRTTQAHAEPTLCMMIDARPFRPSPLGALRACPVASTLRQAPCALYGPLRPLGVLQAKAGPIGPRAALAIQWTLATRRRFTLRVPPPVSRLAHNSNPMWPDGPRGLALLPREGRSEVPSTSTMLASPMWVQAETDWSWNLPSGMSLTQNLEPLPSERGPNAGR